MITWTSTSVVIVWCDEALLGQNAGSDELRIAKGATTDSSMWMSFEAFGTDAARHSSLLHAQLVESSITAGLGSGIAATRWRRFLQIRRFKDKVLKKCEISAKNIVTILILYFRLSGASFYNDEVKADFSRNSRQVIASLLPILHSWYQSKDKNSNLLNRWRASSLLDHGSKSRVEILEFRDVEPTIRRSGDALQFTGEDVISYS